jgi:hypothetical protein
MLGMGECRFTTGAYDLDKRKYAQNKCFTREKGEKLADGNQMKKEQLRWTVEYDHAAATLSCSFGIETCFLCPCA